MAGCRTAQYTTRSTLGDPTSLTVILDFSLMDPTTLINTLPVVPLSSSRIHVRSATAYGYISNATNANVVVRAFRLECTKDCPYNLATLASMDAPSFVIPYIDPLTSNAFRRYFHISSSRLDIIPVGGCLTYTLDKYFPSGKLVTGDVEGNALDYEYVIGSLVWVLFIDTQPVEGSGLPYTPGVTSTKVNYIINNKYTYYMMEEKNPESTLGNVTSGVKPSNVISNAVSVRYQTDNE